MKKDNSNDLEDIHRNEANTDEKNKILDFTRDAVQEDIVVEGESVPLKDVPEEKPSTINGFIAKLETLFKDDEIWFNIQNKINEVITKDAEKEGYVKAGYQLVKDIYRNHLFSEKGAKSVSDYLIWYLKVLLISNRVIKCLLSKDVGKEGVKEFMQLFLLDIVDYFIAPMIEFDIIHEFLPALHAKLEDNFFEEMKETLKLIGLVEIVRRINDVITDAVPGSLPAPGFVVLPSLAIWSYHDIRRKKFN